MTPNATEARRNSLAADLVHLIRYYLGSRRALLILALVAIAVGAAFNWNWLVAVGIAPILVSILPCAAMCALGLCMHKMSSGAQTSLPSRNSIAGASNGSATDTASCCDHGTNLPPHPHGTNPQ